MFRRRPRWFVWWYAAIGAGFVLLAIQRLVIGERGWLIPLRLVIAAGFFALAWFEKKSGGT
jgi:hypothetical protein